MANTKIACVHIAHDEVRIVEGKVNDGVILVTKSATVPHAKRFFHGNRLVFMADMVRAIIDTMKVNSFTTKTLHVVYDNNVEFKMEIQNAFTPKKENRYELDFSFNTEKKKPEPKDADMGIIVHKKTWGKFITETLQGEMCTTVTIERDLVEFLVNEFQSKGYKVASLDIPETALMYMRKFVPFNYDALNKVVIFCKEKTMGGQMFLFTKDAPSDIKTFALDEFSNLSMAEQLVDTVQDAIQQNGLGNPHILLAGDAFADKKEYVECCKALKEANLCCIDTLSYWKDKSAPLNSIRIVIPNTGEEIDLNGKFSLCIALLARELEGKPENLIEGFHPMFVGRGTKKTLTEIAFITAVLFMLYMLIGAGISGYEVYYAYQEYSRTSTATETTLKVAESRRDAVRAQVDAINTIDSRYNEIFQFVYEQVSTEINIASVDTQDMIPKDTYPSSVYDSTEETPSDENSDISDGGNSNYVMQTIVIRGYSRTTEGPVKLYNALVGAGLGEVKIIGVEQVPLPSEETLFAFELTVGTN